MMCFHNVLPQQKKHFDPFLSGLSCYGGQTQVIIGTFKPIKDPFEGVKVAPPATVTRLTRA